MIVFPCQIRFSRGEVILSPKKVTIVLVSLITSITVAYVMDSSMRNIK